MELAVRRLSGAGLISVTDGWFQLTPAGENLWRTRPHGGLAAAVETMRGVLSRRHVPGDDDWVLGEEDHARAVQEYSARLIPTPRRSPEGGPR
ncbi:hypothetical protein GCM10027290_16160 [Micromonospora sonneratiae]